MLSKLDIVLMSALTIFKNADQFVLRPVKATHSCIGLAPNNYIFQFAIGNFAGSKHFREMLPVDKDIMNGPIVGIFCRERHEVCKKFRELVPRHFARSK